MKLIQLYVVAFFLLGTTSLASAQSESTETSKKVIIKTIKIEKEGELDIDLGIDIDLDIDNDNDLKHQVIKIEKIIDGDDPQIIEWSGVGDMPEDIQQQLEELNITIFTDEGELDVEVEDNGEIVLKKVKKIIIINSETETIEEEITEEIIDEKDALVNYTIAPNTLELKTMELYPNPSDGVVNLQFSAAAQATTLKVVDTNGREVYSENLPNFKGNYNKQLHLKNAANGVLFLTITQGDKVYNKKLVLKRA